MCVNVIGYTLMKIVQEEAGKTTPLKLAEKNLHCYSCGGLIRKGSVYLRKDFVKTHYQQCPVVDRTLVQNLLE